MARQATSLVKRQTVTDSVADVVRERIINGEYKGGEQIRQEALALELGVSRIPVREALLQLEGEGLLIIEAHRGAMVFSLSEADAVELFEARALFEPFILGAAMARATAEDVQRAHQALRRYEQAVSNNAAPEDLSKLNWAFHTALCMPADRPRSMAILTSLHNTADRYLRLQIDVPGARDRALQDHLELFEHFAHGRAKQACTLLKSHIANAGKQVIAQLQRKRRVLDT